MALNGVYHDVVGRSLFVTFVVLWSAVAAGQIPVHDLRHLVGPWECRTPSGIHGVFITATTLLTEKGGQRDITSQSTDIQSSLLFYATVERRRLKYLRTGDVGVLTQSIGDIDPSMECGAELRALKLATNLQRRYELSLYSWHNCLASVWNRTSRAYPNADWQSFRADYRITEKFTYKSVDWISVLPRGSLLSMPS